MKKRIRSILCLVLALCVAFAFAACGSKDAKEDAETAAGEAGQAATEAVEDAAAVNYDTAYWGQSEDGAEVFFLIDSKNGYSCLLSKADEGVAMQYVGAGIDNGDGTYTITDNATGEDVTFGCAPAADEDGTDCLEVSFDGTSSVYLYESDASVVVSDLAGQGVTLY